jgi:hypothetical protein
MFMCNSLIWRRVKLESATFARRESDMTFGHITESWVSCPPSAIGRSLPVVNMVKSNAIDWSVVVQVGSQVRAIT